MAATLEKGIFEDSPIKIDFYHYERNYKSAINSVKKSSIPQRNKDLILEFQRDCKIGWGGKKLSLPRLIKYIYHLRVIAEILNEQPFCPKCRVLLGGVDDPEVYYCRECKTKWGKGEVKRGTVFDNLDKRTVKRILLEIDGDSQKGEFAERDYRIALRKFVKWLREEYGYPQDYPDGEAIEKARLILPLLKYPLEVKDIKLPTPKEAVRAEDIPPPEELRYLREAASNPRDEAYFAVSEELGPRVGGIGTRKIKHIRFDDLGAIIIMSDKTMNGETVRITWSAVYLLRWREKHPFKNDPEAPLWVNLNVHDRPVPLDYYAIRAILNRTIKRHNKRAEASNGRLKKITRRMRTHLFRYFAQIRDDLDGVPRSVQCKQRGWSPTSKQPERYAKIMKKDVDEFFRKRLGKNGNGEASDSEPRVCNRCNEANAPKSVFCNRCGFPLEGKAIAYDTLITQFIERLLSDPAEYEKIRRDYLLSKS